MTDLTTSDYELNLYKLNCVEAFYPYLIVGCKKHLIIYQIQVGNINSARENVSYKHLMTHKLESEINYMTKSDHDKIFIVGEKGMTRMLIKTSIIEESEGNLITEQSNSSNSLVRLEKLGLKLINLYQNRNESTWSISYFGGVWVLGDNSHVIKIHLPNFDQKEPFTLIGHKHNLPHLNLYSTSRLLSCSIDQSCKVWDVEERKILYSHDFDECFEMSSNEHIQKTSETCSDIFIIGTQNYIYLLNDTLDTVLFKIFYKPFRGLSHIPQYIYESLDRVSVCRVIPKYNLVLIAKQNDNKVILFRLVHSIHSGEVKTEVNSTSENSSTIIAPPPLNEHCYSLIPITCLPSAQTQNQCIIGTTYDEVLDRIFIQCLDGQVFVYDLNLIISPLTTTCIDNIIV
ncbi:predicted protein [Naegleria gruberi]|uniref:Predicted protein n=1 Tax=Naegleria gruberi TaxID=5762 RepID=D2V5C9_NAEGR|nr:uncharacterized protein NAEGRDRAFT_63777 [Naegleria gruberi]EFC48089.1 predicted protein [Naegleria gruberi]|eukprot:XP_002680833.1 predicted protein [Naegleria gruberi strain NEG-M]